MKSVTAKLYTIIRQDVMLSVSVLLAAASAFFVHPSVGYLSYIDYKTILCLFCLMVTVKGFEQEGLLAVISNGILAKVRTTRMLYLLLVMICFFLSMLITNDVALIAFVPITISVMKLCDKEDKTAFIIILQTIAANIGSSLTPIGNPQNLYIYFRYQMNITALAGTTLPYVLICGLLLAVCCTARKKEVNDTTISTQTVLINSPKVIKIVFLFLLTLLSVAGVIPYGIVTAIIVICMYFIDRSLLRNVDYGLLLTFISIFIFVGNISGLPAIVQMISAAVNQEPVLTAVMASQVISNVPAAILLSEFIADPQILLAGVSIGGLGTLIASMASVISFKYYIRAYPEQIKSYVIRFTLCNVFFLTVLLAANNIISSRW